MLSPDVYASDLVELHIDKFVHFFHNSKIWKKRRIYRVLLHINGIKITEVAIDSHYEIKHSESISDELILNHVYLLNDGDFTPESSSKNFEYCMTENLIIKNKKYRLIWLIEKSELYVGIINAYRR